MEVNLGSLPVGTYPVAIDATGKIIGPVGGGYTAYTLNATSPTTLAAGSAGTAASPTAGSVSGSIINLQTRAPGYTIGLFGTFNSGASVQIESLAPDGVWDAIGSAVTARGAIQNTYIIATGTTLRARNVGTGTVLNFILTVG